MPHTENLNAPTPPLHEFSNAFQGAMAELNIPEANQEAWQQLIDTLPERMYGFRHSAIDHAQDFIAEQETAINAPEPGVLLNRIFDNPSEWEAAKSSANDTIYRHHEAHPPTATDTPFPVHQSDLDKQAVRNAIAQDTDAYVFDKLKDASVAAADEIYLALAPQRSLVDGKLPLSVAQAVGVVAQHDFERKLEARLKNLESVLDTPVKRRLGKLVMRKQTGQEGYDSQEDYQTAVAAEIEAIDALAASLQPDGALLHEIEGFMRQEGFLPLRGKERSEVIESILARVRQDVSPQKVAQEIKELAIGKQTAETVTQESRPADDDLDQRIQAARANGASDNDIYKQELKSLPDDPEARESALKELNVRLRARPIRQHDESFADRYRV